MEVHIATFSYFCHILEKKEMRDVRHSPAVKKSCVRCMATGEDNIRGVVAGERMVKDNKMIRGRFTKIVRNNTGIVEDESTAAQEHEEHSPNLLKSNSL